MDTFYIFHISYQFYVYFDFFNLNLRQFIAILILFVHEKQQNKKWRQNKLISSLIDFNACIWVQANMTFANMNIKIPMCFLLHMCLHLMLLLFDWKQNQHYTENIHNKFNSMEWINYRENGQLNDPLNIKKINVCVGVIACLRICNNAIKFTISNILLNVNRKFNGILLFKW